MKKILLILTLALISTISFSQEVEIKQSGNSYNFQHSVSLTEDKIEVFKNRLQSLYPEINKIEISITKVLIEFKDNTNNEKVNEILFFCSTLFRFQSYKIIKK